VNKQPQNPPSFLVRLFQSKTEKIPGSNPADFQEFSVWKDVCNELLAKPFPPQSSSSDFSADDIERDSRVSFAKLSNWEIVCQEILDTEYSHVYYQKCYDELRRRGKSEREIFEMRRCAWYTAGWFNFPMMLWDWVSLDESDILRAIELLYDKKQISKEQRIEFEDFVKLHA
jgi:hypothetical protein